MADGIDRSGDPLERTFAHFRDYVEFKESNRQVGLIAVFLNADALHEFIHQNVVAAFIVRQFPGARVFAMYRDVDDGRGFVVDSNPYFHNGIGVAAEAPVTIPLDWFDIGVAAPVKCPDPTWREMDLSKPDLFLTPRILSTDAARIRGLAENPPSFRIPPTKADALDAILAQAIGPAEEWHACFSMDPGGESAGSENWAGLAGHIIADQGGKPVCIGRPGSDMPVPKGSIDLRDHLGGFAVQAAALSRARYYLGAGREWPALASAFRIPAAVFGSGSHQSVLWNEGDIVAGAASWPDVADRLARRSADCPAWRTEPIDKPATSAEQLPVPLPMREKTLLEFL